MLREFSKSRPPFWMTSYGHKSYTKYLLLKKFYRTWWRHQTETFSTLLAVVRGIHRPQVNSPHKGQWRGALMFSLICAWTNVWVNNHSHSAQYDVIVMMTKYGSHTEQSVVSQAGIKDRTGFVPAIDTCFCYNVPQYGTDYIYQACIWYKECCVRNGYQAITSHRICGEWLLVPALDSCLWHHTPHMCVFM